MHWKENGWDLPEKQSLWQRGPFFLPDQESESRFLSGSPAQKRPDRLTPHCFTTVSGNALHRAGQPASARSRGLLADIPRVWWRQRRLLCRAIKQKPRLRGVCIKKSKLTDKPGSVVDSHSSRPAIAHWLKQPTRVQYGPYLMNPYLALLRVEFTVPRTVTRRAVRSYRTLSPLPDPTCVGHRRFALCCTGRGLAPPRRYLAPCPMEPGLSSPPPVSPEEDDDEAATVWSASARSIEGLPTVVILPSPSQPAMSPQYYATHDKYCPPRRETPLRASLRWSAR